MNSTKNQQTLFRFISLRAPELTKDEEQDLRFVFFTASSGPFYTAVINRPAETTKWQALQDAANNFTGFNSIEDVKTLSTQAFYEAADWISRNRYNSNLADISQKTSGLTALTAANELKLWNNLFYEVVTQNSYYVKELVSQYLVLQNLLKKQRDQASIGTLANARVVLPPSLFIEDDGTSSNSLKEGNKKPTAIVDPRPLLESLDRLKASELINRNVKAIEELKKFRTKYQKEYNTLYQTATKTYEAAVKTAYANATEVENERIDCPSGCKEIYYEYTNLVLPKFNFEPPKEIDQRKLKTDLTAESYTIVESLSLLDASTYDDIIKGIEESINITTKEVYSGIKEKQAITVGNMVFEQNVITNRSLVMDYEKPFAAFINTLVPDPVKSEIYLAIDFGFPSEIVSMTYTATIPSKPAVSGTKFSSQPYQTIQNLILFPGGATLELVKTAELTLTGEILLDDGSKVTLNTKLSATDSKSGTLKFEDGITERSKDTTAVFAPQKFGVRRLGIADYKKVVSEVCCYKAAEVSHIENIMAREFKSKTSMLERVEETVTTTTTEQEVENVNETSTTERFEMQSEIAKLIQQQKDFSGFVNVHAQYGSVILDTGAAYATSTSKEESNRQAVMQGKELTQRAMERIVSRFRTEVMHRVMETYREENSHVFDNRAGENHVSGVYRYINAVYKNQVLNYGKRLMYEFMVPQPSKFYRFGMRQNVFSEMSTTVGALSKPVDPVTLGIYNAIDITTSNYMAIAARYRASVEAPPEPTLIVGQAYQGNGGNGSHSKEFNSLKVPEGYKLDYISYGYSLRGSGNNNFNAHLIVGNGIIDIPRQGSRPSGYPTKGVGTLFAIFMSDYTNDNIPVSITTWDIGAYSFTLTAFFIRTDELYRNWQLKTYEAIINAYNDRLNEYYNQLNQNQPTPVTPLVGNPLFYRQIEQSIFQRVCISYLIGDAAMGQNYLTGSSFNTLYVDQSQEMDNYASLVKFMEQAFEWNIMSYSLYPYYWGRRQEWVQLFQSDDDDAIFRNFMQAGMARVVVTVKPGFEDAVMYFMSTGKIWNGGQVPVIGDPLYLSIVDELKEQEYEVEETWETVLPTSLIGLQKSGVAVDEEGLPCGSGCEEATNPMIPNNHKLGVEPVNNNP